MIKEKLPKLLNRWKDWSGTDIRPVGAGHYNEVYELANGAGTYILRIAPGDDVPKLFYEVNMMRSEPIIHDEVLAKTGIPAPEIVFHDFSRNAVDRDFLIMKKLDGTAGGIDLSELGRYVAELHSIKGDGFGYPGRRFGLGKNWRETFLEYARNIFSDCKRADAITAKEHDFFLKTFEKNRHIIKECEPALLHLDLWFTNILTKNGKITAILDFDRGMYGDAELEFAVLDTYASAEPEFFAGYRCPRPSGSGAEKRRILYLVYELIKYAFIRLARNHRPNASRAHVIECLSLISKL